jgi:hypothetical protein
MPDVPVQETQAWSDTGNIPTQNWSDTGNINTAGINTAGIPTQAAVGTQVLEREADPAAGAYGGWYSNEPPAANNAQAANQQACKICGGYIDSRTKKCTGCGKQYVRTGRIITWAAAILVVAALAGLNVWQYLKSADQRDKLEASNAEVASVKEQLEGKDSLIAEKDATIESQDSQIQELQGDVDDQLTEIDELLGTIEELEISMEELYNQGSADMEKAYFMDDYVVIVPDDGTEMYHKYGCEYLDLSSFWVYNIDAAINMGYAACPYCN